ncbi:AfsR/SARP family transcriptional regulator [Actinophytocola sp. KF-1]
MDTGFGILGSTEIFIAGDTVGGWGRRREKALLAALLTRPDTPFSARELADWLWGADNLPQRPAAALSTNVSRLRKALDHLPVDADLLGTNGTYRVVVARESIDYHVFRELMGAARERSRRGDHRAAGDISARALSLWRGEPLADLASERANAWRVRIVQNEWLPANIFLIENRLRDHSHDDAISILDELQGKHPQEIRLVALRMSALHGLGRGDEATDLYLATARRLRADGDDHAALYLRRHQDSLAATLSRPAGGAHTTDGAGVLTTPPRLLPPAISGFVGRADQLRDLDTAASAADGDHGIRGVVAVDGMAGVGKTALVLHWGHQARDRFPGGTLYANLDGFSDRDPIGPGTVVDDFLIALEHPPGPDSSPRHRQVQLGKLLSGRRTLVVLDNARNTDHIRDLLPVLANTFLVVTSRQHLTALTTLTGARRVHVEPMDPAESSALLTRHSGLGTLDERTATRAHDLCAGLPLVLHLLADHLAQNSDRAPAAVLDQLNRYRLITTLGDTGDGTINASALFRQSYLALPPPERRLMRLLPVCPGPDFSASACAACDGRTPDDTARSLAILVGAHLLEGPDHSDRYHFHDLLAEFAAHCLVTDETEIARRDAERRVLTFYLRSADLAAGILYPGLPTPPPLPGADTDPPPAPIADREQARRWFDQERTALVLAVAMATDHGHHQLAWHLADPVATDFGRCGYLHDSRAVREHAVVAARADGHAIAEASALVGLGMDCMLEADHQRARDCFTTALRLVEEHHHERGQATVLHQLGRLEALQDNHSAAIDLLRRSLAIATRTGDAELQSWTDCRIGELLRALDQPDAAVVHLHRAAALAQTIDERSAHASSLTGLAGIFLDRGDLGAATAHCAQALALAESVPDPGVVATILLAMADIALTARNAAAAVTHAERALRLCERTHNVATEARAHHKLATVLCAEGSVDDALPHWQTAARLYRRTGNHHRADHVQHTAATYATSAARLPTTRPAEPPDAGPRHDTSADKPPPGHRAGDPTGSTARGVR